jgi:hypothetical protein
MNTSQNIFKLIQSHKGFSSFNYDLTVDWAIELLNNDIESENIYMLASFSKPVDSIEIKPYVSAVLRDLELPEKEGKEAIISKIEYHLAEITQNNPIRRNLRELYEISLENNYGFGLGKFYLLYHAWIELDEMEVNFYYDGADKSNIEDIIKAEAEIWASEHST